VILPRAGKSGNIPDLKAELIYVSTIREALERI
jgi:hypothetical protein